ncbi:MAG: CCA tRNA nucleotidyltransferase, partial [Muribaculaceae bacterium]|nr:CCA tRNA nucleotidyltransferase [Muribaculaceae bacterium]
VFRNFGTAQVHYHGEEFEFVGARRESYRRDSRKPIVEDGTLDDDLSRRDFTINAMAVSVNGDTFGELIDKFNGLEDMERRLIRTPLDPDVTYSDDPLRMMRAVRFATQLQFELVPETFESIKRNAGRLEIISRERIVDELMKIMKSPRPSIGWRLMDETGLLSIVLPELQALKGVDVVKGRGHKDNFDHTLQVLDNVAGVSENVWLRWAALFHDIAKPVTKRWDDSVGWTFHNHNYIGTKMLPKIFRRMKMPMDDKLKYVQKLVELHMRPIALVEDTVTDSAVRRLLVDAGEDIDDLMILCRADITSKNREKVERHLENFAHVTEKMAELEARDKLRNWQPPVDGNLIMRVFGLPQSREVGLIKSYVREAMIGSDTPNDYDLAYRLMVERAAELGLEPRE